jgi:hypothetical protein
MGKQAMDIPTDVFENTSEGLSAVIATVLDSEDFAQPATLVEVREAILAEVKTITVPLNRFSSDQWQELRDEIDALIEEYGAEALAVRFLKPWASMALQRLIEAGHDELGQATLGGLFVATESGLLANLVGQGEIDDDEAQTVIAELKSLIDRHGGDALAEGFIRTP